MGAHVVDLAQVTAALPGYQLGRQLGAGSFGVVLTAHHVGLARDVAVKVFSGAGPAGTTGELRREAQVLARLDHPHVVRVFDYLEHDDLRLVVMELLGGGTLDERRALSPEGRCAAGLAAAAGLAHAHDAGVLHRDVKPDNLIFSADGLLKVCDFGIAKLLVDTGTSTGSKLVGTPKYMAPEQVLARPLSPQTDLYALAVVLYEMLANQPPFEAGLPVMELYRRHVEVVPGPPPGIPTAIAQVVLRGLAKDPADRHPSAQAFAVDLATAATSVFGPGWLARAGIPVKVSDEVGDATKVTKVAPRFPVAPPLPVGDTPLLPVEPRRPRRRVRVALGLVVAAASVAVAVPAALTAFEDDRPPNPPTASPTPSRSTPSAEPTGGGPAGENPLGYTTTLAADIPNSPTLDRILERGRIVVGTKFDLPLFGQQDPTGTAVEGFEAEIARLLALRIFGDADRVDFVEAPASERETLIVDDTVDAVVATYTITDARKAVVAFAGPYYVAGQDLMVAADDTSISGIDDLAGRRVCAVTGSTPAQNLSELAPTAEPVLLDTYDLCAQELVEGTVDAVTTDNVILLGYVSQSPDEFRLVENPFTAWPYGIGVSRDDDVFRDFVNDTLEVVADNGDWFKAFEATVGTVDVVVPDPPAVDRYDTVGG